MQGFFIHTFALAHVGTCTTGNSLQSVRSLRSLADRAFVGSGFEWLLSRSLKCPLFGYEGMDVLSLLLAVGLSSGWPSG